MRFLPENNFYDSVDNGFIDSNGKLSVCKDCIQKLYNELYEKESSIEKAIHKLCMALNIRYSNEAVEAVEAQIDTLAESKKSVKNVFGIYKSKLIATQKTMDKSIKEDMSYTDISTVYVDTQGLTGNQLESIGAIWSQIPAQFQHKIFILLMYQLQHGDSCSNRHQDRVCKIVCACHTDDM